MDDVINRNIIFQALSHRDNQFVIGGSYLQYRDDYVTITITFDSIDIVINQCQFRYEWSDNYRSRVRMYIIDRDHQLRNVTREEMAASLASLSLASLSLASSNVSASTNVSAPLSLDSSNGELVTDRSITDNLSRNTITLTYQQLTIVQGSNGFMLNVSPNEYLILGESYWYGKLSPDISYRYRGYDKGITLLMTISEHQLYYSFAYNNGILNQINIVSVKGESQYATLILIPELDPTAMYYLESFHRYYHLSYQEVQGYIGTISGLVFLASMILPLVN